MLNQQTLDKLYIMKLLGLADGFKEQLQQPSFQDLSFDQRFGMLVDGQWTWKENKRLKRLLKEAKLKLQASIEDIDYKTPRGPRGSADRLYVWPRRDGCCNWSREWSCRRCRRSKRPGLWDPMGIAEAIWHCLSAMHGCERKPASWYGAAPEASLFGPAATSTT